MTIAYIGLGSNLSDPIKQIQQAVIEISKINKCKINLVSALYLSKPMGPQDQDNYINAVLSLETALLPLELLDALQLIENNAGRVRKDDHWGARILDCDILLFGNKTIKNERLTIPHYGMHLREFVLLPLNEIAPELQLPNGECIRILTQNIDHNDIKKLH